MKRAIVWLCWGEQFLSEAIESARSTLAIKGDRVLITDAAGASRAKESTEFTSIIPMRPVFGNNLEKSRLIELIPPGYDTFLFLDTDTRIVGDVTLGFDKAERHGIAMAPAPNYNLSEFFGFGRIMAQLGVKPTDQLMYNSGVIFFHLTSTVRQVLERWRDLAAIGVSQDFPRDQPFLTLAMEQLGFTPYVLSPLYNYRSLGEYAVGQIRAWHSHFPLPPDVNDFKDAWPARRFRDGVRLPWEADATNAMPQGMFDLALPQATKLRAQGVVRSIVEDVLTVQKRQGSRAANELLLKYVGVTGSLDRNESYFANAVNYHLGLVQAYAGDFEQMAVHLRMSCTMPSGEDDQLFSDHVNASQFLRTTQLRAIARGLPPILMTAIPRSASATLTHTLARAIGAPVVHTSVGRFPDYFLVPSWLDMVMEGGAITQDHFSASDFNVGVLSGRRLRNVFVLIRDPRAAARSQVHFLAREGNDTGALGQLSVGRGRIPWLQLRIERECIDNFVPWLQGWINLAKQTDLPFRVHFLTYREVCEDLAAAICKIATILQGHHPAMSAYATCRTVEEVRMHFVSGNDQAWRAEVDDETRERLWAACTSDMKSLLELER